MCIGGLILSLVAIFLSILSLKEKVIRIEKVSLAKPLEKERKRYILFQVLSTERIEDVQCLQEGLEKGIEEMYGKIGLAIVKPKVVYYDFKVNNVIVRCNYEGKDMLIASTIQVREACGRRLKLIPVRAFGTLRSARERIPKVG